MQAFPDLLFGPDVEKQLTSLPLEFSYTIIERFFELNSAAKSWRSDC